MFLLLPLLNIIIIIMSGSGLNEFSKTEPRTLLNTMNPQARNVFLKISFLVSLLCVCAPVSWQGACKFRCLKRPRTGVGDGCEPLGMGAGNELGSSTRTMRVLNHCAVSPPPQKILLWLLQNHLASPCEKLFSSYKNDISFVKCAQKNPGSQRQEGVSVQISNHYWNRTLKWQVLESGLAWGGCLN